MTSFQWKNLSKPFFCLAPLAGISDSAFRQICKECGADIVLTEMVSAEGLSRKQPKTLDLIRFSPKERPIILQLFGKNPESFGRAAEVIENLLPQEKPDGIDLNLGCPSRKVKSHGSGITLMRDPDLVNKIIAAINTNTDLPLSIKIRAGIKKEKITASKFISQINWRKLTAISVHGRYLEQGFSGAVDYLEIKKIKEIVGNKIVIGNGGIKDLKSAKIMLEKTKVDGLMIGQGALGRPWIFEEIKKASAEVFPPPLLNIIKIALKHTHLIIKLKGEEKGMREMRKHLLWYFRGFTQAKKIRQELVRVQSLNELKGIFGKLNADLSLS